MVLGTVLPLVNEQPQVDPDAEAKAQCKSKGGTWDPANRTCILPEPKVEEEPEVTQVQPPQQGLAPKTVNLSEGVGGDKQTIKIGGESFSLSKEEVDQYNDPKITLGFEGLSPQVRRLKELQQEREGILQLRQSGLSPEEARAGGATEEQLAQAFPDFAGDLQQSTQLASQVGSIDNIQAQVESSATNYAAAFMSGVPDLLPDLIAGAATGAVVAAVPAGAAAATGVGAPVAAGAIGLTSAAFALGNLVKGYYSSVVSDIRSQRQSIVTKQELTLQDGKSNLNDLISAANGNPNEAQNALAEFNYMLAIIDARHESLQEESQSDLNKFLGINAIDELAEFNTFYNEGERDNLVREMQEALLNPDVAQSGRLSPDRIKELQRRLRAGI